MADQTLKEWAEEHNYTYGGALKAYHAGRIPGAYQLSHNTAIRIKPQKQETTNLQNRAALYARVSTEKQKESLANQTERLVNYAANNGHKIILQEQDIASGLNENRKGLLHLLKNQEQWDTLIVEHKDRLSRFGTRWIEEWVESNGKTIEYINTTENAADNETLAEDIIAIITSFSGRLYGKRGAKVKAEKAIQQVINND